MSNPTTTCPVCKSTINPKRLSKHLAKVHPPKPDIVKVHSVNKQFRCHCGQLTTFVDQLAHQATHTATKPDRRSAPTTQNQDKQQNLDATKGYFSAYREENRFGSHPAHDDFGDESAP